MLALPTDDRRVVGNRVYDLERVPDVLQRHGFRLAADLLDEAAEADRVDDFGSLEFPGIAVGQPVLRRLMLPAVRDHLAEQPMLVADAVAVGGQSDRGHGLHEAGGKATQAAVAERRVRFLGADVGEIDAESSQSVAGGFGQAEVGQPVHEQAADQELDGQIVDLLGMSLMRASRRAHPAVHNPVPHR